MYFIFNFSLFYLFIYKLIFINFFLFHFFKLINVISGVCIRESQLYKSIILSDGSGCTGECDYKTEDMYNCRDSTSPCVILGK